jgi:acyl-CoA oxidase
MYRKHKEQFFTKPFIAAPYVDWSGYFQGLLPGVGLTISMFRMSIENLASVEQKAHWMPLIQNLDILGCYAQTEIGHGSNVASLETTATLDLATDEFVIHTPTITATKYWPGDLGRFSSHALVFARTIVGDNDYGV